MAIPGRCLLRRVPLPMPNRCHANCKPWPSRSQADAEPMPSRCRAEAEPKSSRYRSDTEPLPMPRSLDAVDAAKPVPSQSMTLSRGQADAEAMSSRC